MKFAIVDDDKVFRMTTEFFLKKSPRKTEILLFENGQVAFDFIREHQNNSSFLPDVILLDINMPVVDGWEFLELYSPLQSDLSKNISIYIVTSSLDDADRNNAENHKVVNGFLVKPIGSKELEHIISAFAF